ncbi:receptor-like protein 9a isoform X2 [Diospyros lotus]|uniref:receptor-like protein 9a isoform X2 n=1 Tax=Diospyros lotus TaxID=55363 RepID=UPI00225B0A78|nr:receptor-like protein 9a isoform X2 [Diospyros lotus]
MASTTSHSMWAWMMTMVVSMLVNEMCCHGCWEQERVALLHLKASINYPNGNSLLSWVDNKSSNCCQWERVECSNTSGRVIQLSLNQTRDWEYRKDWYFNASLFLPFKEIKTLELADNALVGWTKNEGFERLSKLINLEILDLSENYFNNSIILEFVGEISSLKSLYLRDNLLGNSIQLTSFEKLSMLTNLEVLDLSDNGINNSKILECSGGISSLKSLYLEGFEKLSLLTNLEVLDLSNSRINNSKILECIGEISSLKSLYLVGNSLGNSVHLTSFEKLHKLTNLEVLDLSYNEINNSKILEFIGEISSLKSLYLIGSLGSSFHLRSFEKLHKLTNLEDLDLSSNEINNSKILKFIGEIPSLKSLYLYGNKLTNLNQESKLANLEVLNLAGNSITNIIWSSLMGFPSLKILDLRWNYINESISNQGFENVTHLEELYLDNANLPIDFLSNIGAMTSLQCLSLSSSGLNGTLPSHQGLCELKTLQEIDLSYNGLRGHLPWCLANLTSLRFLDIFGNQFSGNIALSPLPNLISLEYLRLSSNNFLVPISFKSFYNLSKLTMLESVDNKFLEEEDILGSVPSFQLIQIHLSNSEHGRNTFMPLPNFFYYQTQLKMVELSGFDFGRTSPAWLLENNTGLQAFFLIKNLFFEPFQLPSSPMTQLLALDISNNNFYGVIPYKIGSSFPKLKLLNMSRNKFEGMIPSSLGNMTSLYVLDLSNNQLSGIIPTQLAMGCSFLEVLKLSNNYLTGPIVPHENALTNLKWLHLDKNKFTEIPHNLFNSTVLQLLNLSHNHLEGEFPVKFCQFDGLQLLDLSDNNFTGTIPSCFNVEYLEQIQLSNNSLNGPFPEVFHRLKNHIKMIDLSNNHFNGSIPNWIDSFSSLSILILKNNHFESNIPYQICHLSNLTLIDLSSNKLSGSIPRCFNNITFDSENEIGENYSISTSYCIEGPVFPNLKILSHPSFKGCFNNEDAIMFTQKGVSSLQVEFTNKGMPLSYTGVPLLLFSAIDLSNNKLTGHIPLEIGNLTKIKALNLSHNNLTGGIPPTLSKLENIESLDLSHNNLNGNIPSQLTNLYLLGTFNVSYNNLSGRIPQATNQFGTFDSSSYIENPFLCGEPLPNNCIDSPPSVNKNASVVSNFIDLDTFYMSFAGSYTIALLAIAGILYINPHWRRAWFHVIEVFITFNYNFVVDNMWRIKISFLCRY